MPENKMDKIMREKRRQEHKQMVQRYARWGMDKGYTLGAYMEMYDILGLTKAEEYTEICEDFIEVNYENVAFVEPLKYKINESQYIRIYKPALSIDGQLLALVKPQEHKISKRTYYELAKAAVSEEHRLTEHGLDGTRGPVWARQIEMVNTNLLEPGQYREICTLAATTNYRALKWINYKKLSSRDFVDIFMTTATKYSEYKWQNMNPAVYYLLDANVPSTLLEDCYMEFANKFGIDTLKADFKTCKNLATLNMLDRIEQRLLARQKS